MAFVEGCKEGAALTARPFQSNSGLTTINSPSQHTQQNQRLTIPLLSKSVMSAVRGKQDECRATAPNFKIGNPSCKPVSPRALPDIPVISNFDDLLATFFGPLPFPLAITAATCSGQRDTSDSVDTWAVNSNSVMGSADQTQQETSHTRNSEMLDDESEPSFVLLDDPSTMMDSPNSYVDPMITSTPRKAISTVTNTSITTSNETSLHGLGFAFNSTAAAPISTAPPPTRPIRKRLLKSPKWLGKAKNSIHSSSSTARGTVSSQTTNVDTSILVGKSHQSQEEQQQREVKDSSIDSHPGTYKSGLQQLHDAINSTSPPPEDNAIQQKSLQQAYSNPVVIRRYRRSVYNAALSDLSPLVSPDGSIIHGSSLYQRSGLASTVSTKAMAARILHDPAIIRPGMYAAPFNQEKTESAYTYTYHDTVNPAPLNYTAYSNIGKRTSKVLVEDEETVTDDSDRPSKEEAALVKRLSTLSASQGYLVDLAAAVTDVAQAKQQRRVSQRLLDAFRAASAMPSTKARVVHPPMAVSSITPGTNSVSKRYNTTCTIDTAWHSWRSYHLPQNSDGHPLKSLQNSLDDTVCPFPIHPLAPCNTHPPQQ